MIISHTYIELKRRVDNGCLESRLNITDAHGNGLHGLQQSEEKYLKNALQLLEHLEEYRASHFSTCQIFYEIMYAYFEMGNDVRGEEYHHYLMWELIWDHPSENLEPYIKKYQIREIAYYLDREEETKEILERIKKFQRQFDPETYTFISSDNFFQN